MTAPVRVVVRRSAWSRWMLPALVILLSIAIVTAGLWARINQVDDPAGLRQQARAGAPTDSITVALPNLVRPLAPEDAVKENEARPFDAVPDTPAQKFLLVTDQSSHDRAVECLTQAVYYEAAGEGIEGQRAVAQVVLNRMRHPGFPPSVCRVVYQGSELPTGCQFTFTCDGSLLRPPVASLWTQAHRVAVEALGGRVDPAVGHATQYHADYVLPYWADSLLKQVQIGHHIFYRLKGTLGSSAAFSQRYAGGEPPPPLPSALVVANQAVEQAATLATPPQPPGPPPLAADAAGIAAASEPKQVVLADNGKGELLVDQGAPQPSATPKRRPAGNDCAPTGTKRILPAGPADFHVGKADRNC